MRAAPSGEPHEVIAVAGEHAHPGSFHAHFDGMIILGAIGAYGHIAERVLMARFLGHLRISTRKGRNAIDEVSVAAGGPSIAGKGTRTTPQESATRPNDIHPSSGPPHPR